VKTILRSAPRQLLVLIAIGTVACAPPQPTGSTPAQQGASSRNPDGSSKTLAEMFEGRFSGVKVNAVSTNSVRLVIRNAQNLDSSPAYPMYLVDGLPVAAPDGVFSFDPNNISKIEVLKDDASTLIYGQAAANGVVKITTKRK
jgi:TonB-dependent SusC/RagA subfamily outer membrane receptor